MPDLRKINPKRKHVGRVPKPGPTSGIELAYYAYIKSIYMFAVKLVERKLFDRLPLLLQRLDSFFVADAMPPQKRVTRIMEQISKDFYETFHQDKVEKFTQAMAKRLSDKQKEDLFRQVKQATGIELSALMDRKLGPLVKQFTAENVSLIRSWPQTYFDRVEKKVIAGMAEGQRHETIAETLKSMRAESDDERDILLERADFIARDQVLSFQSDLNQARQQELGLNQYIWRTAGDKRVRDVHAERDGETYSWDDPPGDASDPGDGANPGDGILCRCWAEPVFDGLFD